MVIHYYIMTAGSPQLYIESVLYWMHFYSLINSPVMVCPFEFIFMKLLPFGKCCQQVIENVKVSLFPKNTTVIIIVDINYNMHS